MCGLGFEFLGNLQRRRNRANTVIKGPALGIYSLAETAGSFGRDRHSMVTVRNPARSISFGAPATAAPAERNFKLLPRRRRGKGPSCRGDLPPSSRR